MGGAALVLPATLGGVAVGILVADAVAIAPARLVVVTLAPGAVLLGATVVAAGRWRSTSLVAAMLALGAGIGALRGAGDPLGDGTSSVTALIDGAEHTITGAVVDDPRPRGDRLQLVLDELQVGKPDEPATPPQRLDGRLLVWLPRGVEPIVGDRLRFSARLEAPRDFEGFAYREYLERQGIGGIARVYAAEVVGRSIAPLAAVAAGIRLRLLDGLNALVPEPEAALGAGILLGARGGIAPEIEESFATAGLTHVVAISGWNIAIVVGLMTAATGGLLRLPGGRIGTPALVLAMVALYVLVTGASPSVVRAALMAAALLVARLGGSRAHATSALMLAALVMLLTAPPVLWDVGFQLSLLATAGLIFFGGWIEARLGGWPRIVREPVALTVAAQLTTLPVILLNFERLSLVAPAANVVVVPLVPLVMLTSAVAALVGTLDGALPVPLVGEGARWLAGGSAWLLLRAMIIAGEAAAAVPFAAVELTAPAWLAAAWYPALALVAARIAAPRATPHADDVKLVATGRPRREPEGLVRLLRHVVRPAPLAGSVVAVLAAISIASLPDGRLHLSVLDVGQGDAILVEAPSGATMLIDGGPDPNLTLRRLGEELPFFARRIDVVLLSHPHQDHVAGLVEVLRRYEVRSVVHAGIPFENPAYDRLLAAAAVERGATVTVAAAGSRIALDDETMLEILHPAASDVALPLPEGDINNGSIVALMRHRSFTALLTGDAEAPVERLLLERGLVVPVDVLKAGHHGSDSSTTAPFLDAANPRIVLISAGLDNEYGHPSAATLAELAARPSIVVRRTDLHGTLEVISDGERFILSDAPEAPPLPAGGESGSIAPWLFQTVHTPGRSWPSTSCRAASSSTPRGWRGSRPARRASSRRPASRSTSGSSRSPPCSTTSISRRSGGPAASTA